MLSKFLNCNNENPLSMGMSTASLFRPINIDNTLESKTEVKHSDKNFAKPVTTVASQQKLSMVLLSVIQRYLLLIILQSTSSSLKQTMIQSSRLVLQARKIKFKTIFLGKTLLINFSQKTCYLNFLEISPRNGFRRKRLNQRAWVVPNTKGTHNSRLMNPSSVKYYSQENAQNLDFDPQQTKQPIELSNTMTNFNQFSENSYQNATHKHCLQ